MKKSLTSQEKQRYKRHLIIDEIGEKGQLKLLNSKVLIIGAGGLGSPIALYLAAAGIGTIGIADHDKVDISNLQRQIIHTTKDIQTLKVNSAKAKMSAINPDISIITYPYFLDQNAIFDIVKEYDFVIDATDNFDSKFLINEACVKANKPFSHGGVLKLMGQTMTIIPKKSACYACIFDSPPPSNAPSCSADGILGTIPGVIGTIQATETIKYLVNFGELLTNRLLIFESEDMEFNTINLQKNPVCRVCGNIN